jgi:hypothetical protein
VKHTADEIATSIRDVMEEYGLLESYLMGLVTDTASNMNAMG